MVYYFSIKKDVKRELLFQLSAISDLTRVITSSSYGSLKWNFIPIQNEHYLNKKTHC